MDILLGALLDFKNGVVGMYQAMSSVWFLVLPFPLYFAFKEIWMDYVCSAFMGKIQYVLLEIIPPQNIEKSPKLMESLFLGMAGVMKTPNVFEEFLDGFLTYRFSLELVSDEGMVHFFVRSPKQFRNLVEAHLYAQYPDIEIREVPDYTKEIPPAIPNRMWDVWGADMELTGPDPLPIRTYKFFEEDITGTMIDPLAGLIEVMGKLGPNQKIWLQYVIKPLPETWAAKEGGKELVEKLAGRLNGGAKSGWQIAKDDIGDIFRNIGTKVMGGELEFTSHNVEKKDVQPVEFRLTPGEKKVLEALEGNIGKNMFATKMRFLYLGRRENFTKDVISGFMGGIKQFSDLNLNGFKPQDASKTYANFVFKKSRLRFRQRRIFNRYLSRNMDGLTFVLSAEELATVFHMPDMAVKSPFIQRVPAKSSGAPANLPIMR